MSKLEIFHVERSIICIKGEIDISNIDEFDTTINDAIKEAPSGFIIDLSEVTYIDSSGIRSILMAYKHISSNGGKLALIINTDKIEKLLKILGLDQIPNLEIYNSLDTAEKEIKNNLDS